MIERVGRIVLNLACLGILYGALAAGMALAAPPATLRASATSEAVGPASAEDRTISLDRLIGEIRRSEQKLSHIRVSGKSLGEKWDATTQIWTYNGESQATAWYTGMPGSKAKIAFDKLVLPCIDGPKPFAEERVTFAYTGKVGQILTESMDGRPLLRGAIQAERPGIIAPEGPATGWSLSLYGTTDDVGMRLSDLLQQWQDHSVTAEYATIRGTRCVRVALTRGDETRSWYLDPAKAYALLQSETVVGKQLFLRASIQELAEAAPGVYYPAKAVREYFPLDKDRETVHPSERTRWELWAAAANASDWSDDVFEIHWSNGTVIEDRINHTGYRVGTTPRIRATQAAQQGVDVQKAVTIKPPSDNAAESLVPLMQAPARPVLAPASAPVDAWTQYVQQFIASYKIDDAQQQVAWSILKELKGRAQEYRISHKPDYDAVGKITDKTQHDRQLQTLDAPIDQMFEELKTRLMLIPTEAQRNAVTTGKSLPADTRPAQHLSGR
jgi:hypothetical protein